MPNINTQITSYKKPEVVKIPEPQKKFRMVTEPYNRVYSVIADEFKELQKNAQNTPLSDYYDIATESVELLSELEDLKPASSNPEEIKLEQEKITSLTKEVKTFALQHSLFGASAVKPKVEDTNVLIEMYNNKYKDIYTKPFELKNKNLLKQSPSPKPTQNVPSKPVYHRVNDTVKDGNCGVNAVNTALAIQNPSSAKSLMQTRNEMVENRKAFITKSNIQEKIQLNKALTQADLDNLSNAFKKIFGNNIELMKKYIQLRVDAILENPNNSSETIINILSNNDATQHFANLTNFDLPEDIWIFILACGDFDVETDKMPTDTEKNFVWLEKPNIVGYMLSKDYQLLNVERYDQESILCFQHLLNDKMVYIANNVHKNQDAVRAGAGTHWYCVSKNT